MCGSSREAGTGQDYQTFSLEIFYNLPFQTAVELVSQLKLLVCSSPLKLGALLGLVTAIQKFKPLIEPENTVSKTFLHVSGKKVCMSSPCRSLIN